MQIAFVASEWAIPTPIDVVHMFTDKRGLTGSETSLFMFANEVAKAGHAVTVFTNVTEATAWGNVECQPIAALSSDRIAWDVAIAWLDPKPLQGMNARKRVLNQQVNDFGYCAGWEPYIDLLLSPSATHREYLRSHTNFPLDKWKVLYNGVDPEVFEASDCATPRPRRMIYASSPDRGLHWLLEAFPRIRREVPGVELHVYYQWKQLYERVRYAENKFGYRLRYVNEAFRRFDGAGVFSHGAVSKSELAAEMAKSRVLAYPCDPMSFTEGFSVTTLESAVSGCVPVIVGADALQEVYGGRIPVIKAPYKDRKDEYISKVVELLRDDRKWSEAAIKGRESCREDYSWAVLGKTLLSYLQ